MTAETAKLVLSLLIRSSRTWSPGVWKFVFTRLLCDIHQAETSISFQTSISCLSFCSWGSLTGTLVWANLGLRIRIGKCSWIRLIDFWKSSVLPRCSQMHRSFHWQFFIFKVSFCLKFLIHIYSLYPLTPIQDDRVLECFPACMRWNAEKQPQQVIRGHRANKLTHNRESISLKLTLTAKTDVEG